jgi:hypothetical protein
VSQSSPARADDGLAEGPNSRRLDVAERTSISWCRTAPRGIADDFSKGTRGVFREGVERHLFASRHQPAMTIVRHDTRQHRFGFLRQLPAAHDALTNRFDDRRGGDVSTGVNSTIKASMSGERGPLRPRSGILRARRGDHVERVGDVRHAGNTVASR